MPESAPDQAPRALLAFSPTARVLGFSGPPGAAASGGQHRHALARPKRDAGSLAWTHEHQNRRATSSHDRISAPAPSPPPAPSEAGPPGAHLRHALHGTVGLTHAPRSSADAPASPTSRLVHPHATVLPPTRPPKSTGRLLPTRAGRGPDPPPGVTCRAGRARRTIQAARSDPSNARISPRSSPARASRVFPHSTSARLQWAAGRRGVRRPTQARLGEAQARCRKPRLDPRTPESPRHQLPRPYLGSRAFPPTGS
jgi:hypothetical protein